MSVGDYFTCSDSKYSRKFVVITAIRQYGFCSFCEVTTEIRAIYISPRCASIGIAEKPKRKPSLLHGRILEGQKGEKTQLVGRDGVRWIPTGENDSYLISIAYNVEPKEALSSFSSSSIR